MIAKEGCCSEWLSFAWQPVYKARLRESRRRTILNRPVVLYALIAQRPNVTCLKIEAET